MKIGKRGKIALGVVAGAIALCGFGAALSGGDEPAAPADAAPATVTTVDTEPGTQPTDEPEATTQPASQPEATTPGLTVAQQNAVRKAQQYLEFSAFSRSGLIDQLEYEGFSTKDATLAVDSLDVDWMEQAAKKAQQYLEFSAFSRSGLIDQLEYEGFTPEQAAYGADAVGL